LFSTNVPYPTIEQMIIGDCIQVGDAPLYHHYLKGNQSMRVCESCFDFDSRAIAF
jgi:hypothetical protein